MANFDGLISPSYRMLATAASCDETINFYFEAAEYPHTPKSKASLFSRGGSSAFGAIPPTIAEAVRGMMQFDGNGVPDGAIFGVSGSSFWQMNLDGSQTAKGSVVDDGKPAYISANAASVGQIFIASGDHGYCLDTNTGVFAEIPVSADFFGARDVTFIDGYFVVLSDTTNRQQFQISALNDGTTWSGADVGLLLGQTDPIQRVIANIEYLYFIGTRRGQIWYNNGNALFPFTIQSGAFLEVGTNAPGSVCQSGSAPSTTIFYIGQDARGAMVAVKIQGLESTIISTPAVSQEWDSYSTVEDCICYPITWNGHALIRYIFPTADMGWEYDITETARVGFPVWNKYTFTDANGVQHAPFERAHAFAFQKHLIGSGGGDSLPGAVYELKSSYYSDCAGNPNGAQIIGAKEAVILLPIAPADTSLPSVAWIGTIPTAPFYFFIAGDPVTAYELILCMGYTGPIGGEYTLTVVRGQGGTTAQSWGIGDYGYQATLTGFPITRERICRLPFNMNFRQFLDRIELLIQAGVGLDGDTQQGTDPVLLLNMASSIGTSGPIWGPDIELSMGQQGEYQTRLLANRFGYYRDGAIRIRCTEPVFTALVGAQIFIRPGGS